MNPAPDFDRLARVYRWLEYLTFGPFLWRCRVHFLARSMPCRRALVLGDGDGRFTGRLLHENRQIRVHALDASPRMIAALEKTAAADRNRLTTGVADLRTWLPAETEKYDVVVSHFFLDCLATEEIAGLAGGLTPFLEPRAIWLISEFRVPAGAYGHAVAAPLVAFLYWSFGLLTGLRQRSLPDHAGALSAAGWILEDHRCHLGGLLISQLWRRSQE